MTAFGGFPPELFTFFDGLARDNSKSYWTAHETDWHDHVRTPFLALLDDLAGEFGPMRMFRPHRDLRFSKDRAPYKLWAGATSESRAAGGIGYHIEVSATGLIVGYGAMLMVGDQLRRFRAAIDDDAGGRAFEALHSALAERSLPITSGAQPPLKSGPRGYPSIHPRSEFLRWRGAAIVCREQTSPWMHTPDALERIRSVWRTAQPLQAWLDAYVGRPDASAVATAGRPPR